MYFLLNPMNDFQFLMSGKCLIIHTMPSSFLLSSLPSFLFWPHMEVPSQALNLSWSFSLCPSCSNDRSLNPLVLNPSQSRPSLSALGLSFPASAVFLPLSFVSSPSLLERSLEHTNRQQNAHLKNKHSCDLTSPLQLLPVCQWGFTQGNIIAVSDVGVTGTRPHSTREGAGGMKVQRRELEGQRKIMNQAVWTTCGWPS